MFTCATFDSAKETTTSKATLATVSKINHVHSVQNILFACRITVKVKYGICTDTVGQYWQFGVCIPQCGTL